MRPHRDFGLTIDFDQPVEIRLYDEAYGLDHVVRKMIVRYGFVTLCNVYMS